MVKIQAMARNQWSAVKNQFLQSIGCIYISKFEPKSQFSKLLALIWSVFQIISIFWFYTTTKRLFSKIYNKNYFYAFGFTPENL